MRRSCAAFFATVLMLGAGLPAALGGQDPAISGLLEPLFSPPVDAFGNVLAVGADGSHVVLSEGHDPISGDVFVYDYRGLDGPATDPTGDAGEGAPENLDIISGFALRLEMSPEAVAAFDAMAGIPPGAVEGGFGFATPFDGTSPSFPAESAFFGFQSGSWVTAEDDPTDIKLTPRFQFSLTGLRNGDAPTETEDANGGNSFSIDMYRMNDLLGIGSYNFPSGQFVPRETQFFGMFLGDRAALGGPFAEVEGVGEFEINFVDWPMFDSLSFGNPSDWPTIRLMTFAEGDANGDGVLDEFEVEEEPEPTPPPEEPADETPTEEPGTEPPGVVDQPDEPADEPADQPSDEGAASGEPPGSDDGGGGAAILIVVALLLLGGGVGVYLWLKNREQEKCVPEAQALASAKAAVSTAEGEVAKAKEQVADASAALERAAEAVVQPELRQQEARIALREAESELALAEGRLQDARGREAAAQHSYNVCMGLAAPAPAPEPAPPPPAPEPPSPPSVGAPAGGPPGVVADPPGGSTTAPPPATAPGPEKEEGCEEGDVRVLEELGSLNDRFVLGYSIVEGTEGYRTASKDARGVAGELQDIADALEAINNAASVGSGAGALIAEASTTVLELTARLGAGTAAFVDRVLEGHRVHTFTYMEIGVYAHMEWRKVERCVGGKWECFYELEITKLTPDNKGPITRTFEGRPDLMERDIRVYKNMGDEAVRHGAQFELFMDAAYVGPC